MNQEKTNFIRLGSPNIVIKRLTKRIIMEAIQAYTEDAGYWLKFYQFADSINISIFNKLEAKYGKEWGE